MCLYIKVWKWNALQGKWLTRTRFPSALAGACTMHKFQRMTLPRVAVSLVLFNQKSFNYGHLYESLSRTTSFEGLYLKGPITESMFRANPIVTEHYQRLLSCKNALNEVFLVLLLNLKSLVKHACDAKFNLERILAIFSLKHYYFLK